jgi:hypothetical protein
MLKWVFNNFSIVFPIVITMIIGIIGVLFKTKKDDKNGLLHRPTIFGFAVIAFLILITCFNIESQYNTFLISRIKTDSLNNKAFRDSVNNRNEYLYQLAIDSVGHARTIKELKKQSYADSQKIKEDSFRYNVTLGKFGEQLSEQNQTLQNINKILHPLFPLKIDFEIKINSDDLTKDTALINMLFRKGNSEFRDAKKNKSRVDDIVLVGKQRKFSDTSAYSDSIEFYIRKFIPKSVSSIISATSFDDEDRSMLEFNINDINTDYNYSFDLKLRRLLIEVYTEIIPSYCTRIHIQSFEETKGSKMLIGIFTPRINTPFSITSFNFNCGSSFLSTYRFALSESEIQSVNWTNYKYYLIPITQ